MTIEVEQPKEAEAAAAEEEAEEEEEGGWKGEMRKGRLGPLGSLFLRVCETNFRGHVCVHVCTHECFSGFRNSLTLAQAYKIFTTIIS